MNVLPITFFGLLLVTNSITILLISPIAITDSIVLLKENDLLNGLLYLQPILLLGLFLSYRKNLSDNSIEMKQPPIASRTDKILDAVSGCVISINQDHFISYINQAAEKLIGFGKNYLDQHISYIFTIQDHRGKPILQDILSDQERFPKRNFSLGQIKLITHQQGERYINLSTRSILVDDDKISHGIVLVFRDVTADRKVMNTLYRQASQDALTGLINRSRFERSLEHVLQANSMNKITNTLIYIDLDHFKSVNDTCGHVAGDELLKQVAQIFSRYVRQLDKVARVGGDEFAILLQACSTERAKSIVESILNDLRSFRFTWQDRNFVVGASIGLVEFDSGIGKSLKGLLNTADQACYMAKKLGRDQYYILSMDKAALFTDPYLINWKEQIEFALENNGFSLMAQPIVPLQKERLDSIRQYELLIRLNHENNSYKPGSFLPAAERLGLMKAIDKWVILHVLERAEKRYSVIKPPAIHYRLMINLSTESVQDENFIDFIKQAFNKSKLPPSLLGFEVSEPVAVANFSAIKKLFNGLKELGCGRVLDDFGSGFSSLSYLRELPVNYLKIDGAFVRNLANNDVDAAMVKAVNQVGKVMNLFSIAESVEDEHTLDTLRQLGIDFAQGYHCGKPLPFESFCSKLDSKTIEQKGRQAIAIV